MGQQGIDFIGGGFKLTLPYTFGGWVVWAFGLVITGFGFAQTTGDAFTGLAVAGFGLVILASASPGSLSAGLHKLRKQ
ncbi:MAG: hypothetical protein ACO3L7_04640, partial [Poseidonia sp.]